MMSRLAATMTALCALLAIAQCTSAPTGAAPHQHGSPSEATSAVTAQPPFDNPHRGHASGNVGSVGEPTVVPAGVPSGYAAVPLEEGARARLNLTQATVEERDFRRTVRTVGAVTVDETRSSHVHPKVRGWVDQVQVNYTGQAIRQGSTLCTLYSPEILSAELELLAVLGKGTPPSSASAGTFADIEQRARAVTLDAARRRLTLWDVPASEIQRLEQTREPRKTFPLLAPRSGTVVAKQAIAGMYVDASAELYLVSDLSRVWVLVDLYEADVPFVKLGDKARLSIEGMGPNPIDAALTFLAPTIDEPTRTLKARFELDNRSRQLRPGAFVTAEMDLDAGRGLGVPEGAVIRTGSRNITFVVESDRVEPREVTLGPIVGGWYRVLSGLHAGEQVAASAQFLLDSESRIRATSAPGAPHVH
jgi:Cu(I)/Ag(I) efflux system membrane fusion protein